MKKFLIAILLVSPFSIFQGCGRADSTIVDSGRTDEPPLSEEELTAMEEQTTRDLQGVN